MTKNQIAIQYLVRKLRWKYQDKDTLSDEERKRNKAKNDALNSVLWYSLPAVYPNWEREFSQITRAIDNRKQKKKRVRRMVRDIFDCYDEVYFVTLTFDDDTLASTCERTRHRYAQQWLEANSRDYLANIDYGKENGREHYHAVVAYKKDVEPWKCGFSHSALIDTKGKSDAKISAYINKLSNHAGKVSSGKMFRKRGGFKEDIDKLPF